MRSCLLVRLLKGEAGGIGLKLSRFKTVNLLAWI